MTRRALLLALSLPLALSACVKGPGAPPPAIGQDAQAELACVAGDLLAGQTNVGQIGLDCLKGETSLAAALMQWLLGTSFAARVTPETLVKARAEIGPFHAATK